MIHLIKLHLGLVKYLGVELLKKRTSAEFVKFLFSVVKIYFKELLKIYKTFFLIFDKDYQKQKKQYNNYQKIKVDLQRAIKMLQYIDKKMDKAGFNRQRRRQFWRDFYKDGQVRKDMFDDLAKEIGE